MEKKIYKKAFTLVELIIVITILSILSTIGFYSMTGYLVDTRNSQRVSDLGQITAAIETYKNQKGKLPIPADYFGLKNGSTNKIAWQGKLSKNVGLSTMDKIPFDPKLDIPYLYSITATKQEFQLAGTLESDNRGDEGALLVGNYSSVAKTILPTLLVATGAELDVTTTENKKLFIFNDQIHNLPYSFNKGLEPISDGTDFSVLLNDAETSNNFSQTSDFETCEDVEDALKDIGDGDYELREDDGTLTSSGCTF